MERGRRGRDRHRPVALTIKWGKDGAFETAGKTTGVDKKEAQNLVGAHVLVFP